MQVIKRNGTREAFSFDKIERLNNYATEKLAVDSDLLRSQIKLLVYDGMSTKEIFQAQIKAAAGLISTEHPNFTFVAARYLLMDLYKEVAGAAEYPDFASVIGHGIEHGRYTPELAKVFSAQEIQHLGESIVPERDLQFDYYGLQNVADRYLKRDRNGKTFELPQHFFMRVAMGVSLLEKDPVEAALKFYDAMSTFRYMASTPTLFNSGTVHSQMSSCYVNTAADQISVDNELEPRYASIFGTIEESARLSKYAGGIGTSWTKVRGSGSKIASTGGTSSGVIPYLKIYNDTAVAVNQGGARKGSFAPYLEVWHPDFWDFCELKKEFGDERLRAHDIFPAAWVCDLFMERVEQDGVWSEFQPHVYPELHELYGDEFRDRYTALEAQGAYCNQRRAVDVWKRILSNLFETGHPWITFKDEMNRRNPQSHVGTIHSSNLCTEISLNTSDDETAVCNLGSVNLARHLNADGSLDNVLMKQTVETAVRMLDNVIDLNYYPSHRAAASNMRHRPIGLGIMGETEAKVAAGIPFDCEESVTFSDNVTERISYWAIWASARLAVERGEYESFEGSKWSHGRLPIWTARDSTSVISYANWRELSGFIREHGIRNSNIMAIAPTATISTITGTTPCIEPIFEIERSEKNLSGQFKVVDPCVRYGRPELLRTVWEIDPIWILRCAAARQKWVCQSQSTNIFVKAGTKGKEIAEIYMQAWKLGLKSTYYLRGQSKSAAPKQVLTLAATVADLDADITTAGFCSIDNPNCESCQ